MRNDKARRPRLKQRGLNGAEREMNHLRMRNGGRKTFYRLASISIRKPTHHHQPQLTSKRETVFVSADHTIKERGGEGVSLTHYLLGVAWVPS